MPITRSGSSTARWMRWSTAISAWGGGRRVSRRRPRRWLRSCRSPASDRPIRSPTLVIDGTFGWTRFGQDVEPRTSAPTSARKCSAFREPTALTRASGMPPMSSRVFRLGNPEGWNPLYRNDQSYTFNTNATWAKGAHDVRFGFDFVHHLMNHWQPELGEGPRGAFHFDPGVTALNPDALAPSGSRETRHRSRTTGTPWGVSARHAGLVWEEQPIHQDGQQGEQCALYIRGPLARHPEAHRRPGPAVGALPEPAAVAGSRHRVGDPTTNEALIGGRAESRATTALDTARSCSRRVLASPIR